MVNVAGSPSDPDACMKLTLKKLRDMIEAHVTQDAMQ